jgi:hypothetical protein
VTRGAGWRVPSVTTTRPGLPDAWIDGAPVPTTGGAANAAEAGRDTPGTAAGELAEFGRSEAMIRRWRGWSFRRRDREAEPSTLDAPADLDLVALAAEDDLLLDADDQAWTDLTLAALEDTDSDDAWTPGPDPSGVEAADGPWSTFAEELQTESGFATTAPDVTESTTLELEEEFWARGTR